VAGRYQIVRFLAAGGAGEVYEAFDRELVALVALKTLHRQHAAHGEAIERFKRELQLARQVAHPSVCRLYDVGRHETAGGSVLFLTMELLDGETLAERIRREGRLTTAQALPLVRQMASALDAAHALGIVHRDFKSGNVMLVEAPGGGGERAVVTDFGLARYWETAEGETSLTESGHLLGTPLFMAPEQLDGSPVTSAADVYSFGLVLYQMVTGQLPFSGGTPFTVAVKRLAEPPRPARVHTPDLDPRWEAAIAHCLARQPDRRPRTAGEALRELEAPLPPRRRWWGAAALALAAALVALVLVLHRPGHEPAGARPKTAAAAPLALVPAGPRGGTLAVLPFANLGTDRESDFLGPALADAVAARLAQVGGLHVRPPAAVAGYRPDQDPRAAGEKLAVDHLVTGSFRRDERGLVVSFQLLAPSAGPALASERLDLAPRALEDAVAGIAGSVVAGLRLPLTAEERRVLAPELAADPVAYEYYLRGVYLLLHESTSVRFAVQMLERATKLAPDYAPAWAALCDAYKNFTGEGAPPDALARAEAALARALELDPRGLPVQLTAADLRTETGHGEDAIADLLALAPAHPENAQLFWKLSYALRYAGLLSASVRAGERALALDPWLYGLEGPSGELTVFNAYLYEGDYERFLARMPKTREHDYWEFYRGFAYLHLGDEARAKERFARAFALNPETTFSRLGRALTLALEGRPAEGRKLLAGIEASLERNRLRDGEVFYKLAQAHASLGEPGPGIAALRKSVELGFFCTPYMARDPLLAPLRTQALYPAIFAAAERRHQEAEARFGAALARLLPAGG
jgi:TolB-like protein/Tfp pilus assembly protein PilF